MELREVLEMCDKVAPMVAPSIPFIVTVQHPDKVGLRIYFWTPPEEKVVQFLRALDFEELCPHIYEYKGEPPFVGTDNGKEDEEEACCLRIEAMYYLATHLSHTLNAPIIDFVPDMDGVLFRTEVHMIKRWKKWKKRRP